MTVPAGRMPAAPAPRRRPGARPRLATKRRRGRVRTRAEYLALRVVMGLLGALPLSLALRLGELGALLAYALDVSHRRVGMTNLGVAFPERPLRERRRILRRSFLNLGYMAAELAHLPGLGVFVDVFGLPASTNSGMARIALRTDAPIVPAFIVREGRSARHRVHVLPILQVERTGDPAEDVRRNTQRFTAVFEEMVRRHPEQWLWMHKRWKTRPPGEPRFY